MFNEKYLKITRRSRPVVAAVKRARHNNTANKRERYESNIPGT